MTFFLFLICYYKYGDSMKVKIFDEEHEKDLEEKLNEFLLEKDIVDIKYQVSVAMFSEEQIYCYSALVIYE